ncbi:polysaccharide deacetylase family protein [Vibrio xiamenensis]|uniref:polysaccharide deacetylase family protein n=1 Tax=Vibrio xiamenensis TaxID=861298 RepID=UPI0015A25A16|nr:polysaccharide deacetylase family protein [Vibrio xiamenensis]
MLNKKAALTRTSLLLLLVSGSVSAYPLNVLLYHHVADDTPFTTSTKVADFLAQLDDFKAKGYQIVDLEQAVTQIKNGQLLKQKSLALTFDDAFASVCNTAYPELKKRKLPFTVFVVTKPIDHHYPDYCSWAQLKEMSANGVTIANHSVDHAHLVKNAFSDDDWLEATKQNITAAGLRISEQIGKTSTLFAYPYGEYNNDLKAWMKQQGYIAFGQQSGSIDVVSDWQALPRFNAAGNYATPKALRHKISAQPLPLDYAQLPSPQTLNPQPELKVTVMPSKYVYYPHLQCYLDGQSLKVDWENKTTFVTQPDAPMSAGRHRLNCTAPHRNGWPYYWLSQQWVVAKDRTKLPSSEPKQESEQPQSQPQEQSKIASID